eukprot:5735549-Karenia_brevis.AAC.1
MRRVALVDILKEVRELKHLIVHGSGHSWQGRQRASPNSEPEEAKDLDDAVKTKQFVRCMVKKWISGHARAEYGFLT